MKRTFFCILLLLSPLFAVEVSGLRVRIVPQGDEVEPSVLYFESEQGTSVRRRFTLENRTEKKVRVRLYPTDASNTADGALAGSLFGEENDHIGDWVKLSHQVVELSPGERERVTCELSIPSDAEPGDHVGFVYIESAPGSDDIEDAPEIVDEATFKLKMKLRFGVPVLLRLPGAEAPALPVQEAKKAYKDGKVGFEESVSSSGDWALRVQRDLTLFSPSGEKVFTNSFKGYVLPQGSWKLWTPISSQAPLARGTYKLRIRTTATIPNRDDKLSDVFEQELVLP